MLGSIDSLDNGQETTLSPQFSTDENSISTFQLIDWFCQLQHHFLLLWWCFHLQWTFSLRFEISPAPVSLYQRTAFPILMSGNVAFTLGLSNLGCYHWN